MLLLLPHGAWTQVSKDYVPPHLQQLNNGCQSFGWRDRPEARELGSTGSYGRLWTTYSCQAVRPCMCVLRFTVAPAGPSAVQSWPNAKACPTSKLLPETSAKAGTHPTVKPCLLPPSPRQPSSASILLPAQPELPKAGKSHSRGVFTRPLLQHQGRWCRRVPRQF